MSRRVVWKIPVVYICTGRGARYAMSSGLQCGDSAMKSPSFPQCVHRLGPVLHRSCTPLSTAKSLTYPGELPGPGRVARPSWGPVSGPCTPAGGGSCRRIRFGRCAAAKGPSSARHRQCVFSVQRLSGTWPMSHRIVTWHGTFGTLTRLNARRVVTVSGCTGPVTAWSER